MELLTEKQVTEFFRKLGISKEEEKCSKRDASFLTLILRRYISHPEYAFENLSFASEEPSLRKEPSRAESISKCLNKLQGVCIDHNYFMMILLKSIGYKDVFNVASTVSLLPMPTNHPLVIVKLNTDEIWMIDCGMGTVCNEPVPLHSLPFQCNVGGYPVQFRKIINHQPNGIDLYQRVHLKGDLVKGDFDVDEEVRHYFTLEPVQYEIFQPAMKTIFTDAETSFFLNTLYLFRYTEKINENDGNYECIIIIGTTVLKFNGAKILEKSVHASYGGKLREIFTKYFPSLSIKQYEEATKYFKTSLDRN